MLVDGRRHVGSFAGSTAVDINTIPAEWIERVEIITGGASAIYGADAVTGVVNIILKKNIEGFSARFQDGGAADNGFNRRHAGFSAGRNFEGGRGNAAISFEYSGQDRLRALERGFSRTNFTFLPNPDDPDGMEVGENDGIPDSILARDGGRFFINDAGVFFDNDFNPFTFNADRSVRPVGLGDAPDFDNLVCAGPGCDALDRSRYNELQPDFERYVTQARLRFELAPHHDLFVEAKFAHSSANSLRQPTFDFIFAPASDLLPIFGIPIFRDNAFIQPDLAALMDDLQLESISLNRVNDDLGFRFEDNDRDLFRAVIGAEGPLLDSDWMYELSMVHGRFTQTRSGLNNRITARFFAATDAVRDPDSGEIVCRSAIDPAAVFPETDIAVDADSASGCIPVNLFGPDGVSEEAARRINAPARDRSTVSQAVLTAFVQNRNVASLPAGPLGLALGTEFRRETSRFTPDALRATGATFEAASVATRGEFEVYEGFVEAVVPLLASLPGVHALTLDAALRRLRHDRQGHHLEAGTGLRAAAHCASARHTQLRHTRAHHCRSVRSAAPEFLRGGRSLFGRPAPERS